MAKKLYPAHYILAGFRALLLVILLILCLVIFLPTEPFMKSKSKYANGWRRAYCKMALWILGCTVQLTYETQSLPDHYLLVSNHTSFSDPLVTLAFLNGMPVAKAEIRRYPIIGYAALKTGIIYVKRDEKNSRANARKAVFEALQNGRSVLVYPEGTISPRPKHLHPFRTGVFHSAFQSDAPIIAMAIHYEYVDSFWSPNRNLLEHFVHQFGKWRQRVSIKVSSPIKQDTPRLTAERTQHWIQNKINNLL
jgi:1-acyl-sn-glycerol-3-phosphate acyltransferase